MTQGADLTALAEACGLWLRPGRDGAVELDPVPDIDTAEVAWTYTAGDDPTYLDAERKVRGRDYNRVVVRGEPEDGDVVEVTVEDEETIGRWTKTYFIVSPFIVTEQQAEEAGLSRLARHKGQRDTLTIESVTLPTRDVMQAVRVDDERLRIANRRYLIESVAMPLMAGPMTVTTRSRPL